MDFMKAYYSMLLILGSTYLVLAAENSTSKPQYIQYVDEKNITHVIDLNAKPDFSVLQRSTEGNIYLLYTRKNRGISQRLYLNDANSVTSSNYNPYAQTIVIVHGWGGNQNSDINPTVRDAYLNVMDGNVIELDWSRVSNSNYVTAALGVPGVGRSLGQFLAFLINTAGGSLSNMHLAGFSLGAHVVGNAGKYLDGKVARITGLDPAGPLWSGNDNRLRAGNAVYVEAIHTDRRFFGTSEISGNVDFYPNGGFTQPGCATDLCNHNRSWQLFAATITYDHLLGRKCSSALSLSMNLCFGATLSMGNDDLRKTGNGLYRLKTDDVYPYRQIN